MSIVSHSPRTALTVPLNELAGFFEAQAPPSAHGCDLLPATLDSGEIVLLCFTCGLYWHTGKRESEGVRFISESGLRSAAEIRYSKQAA